MGFFQRNRDPLLVAAVTSAIVAVLNAVVPELRSAIISSADAAAWLLRPMRVPPVLLLALFLAIAVSVRRRR